MSSAGPVAHSEQRAADLRVSWSGWPDLNRRPLRPEQGAQEYEEPAWACLRISAASAWLWRPRLSALEGGWLLPFRSQNRTPLLPRGTLSHRAATVPARPHRMRERSVGRASACSQSADSWRLRHCPRRDTAPLVGRLAVAGVRDVGRRQLPGDAAQRGPGPAMVFEGGPMRKLRSMRQLGRLAVPSCTPGWRIRPSSPPCPAPRWWRDQRHRLGPAGQRSLIGSEPARADRCDYGP